MGRNNQEPVVVVSGVPRSGTSMMMQVLKAGGMSILADDLRVPDRHNARGYYELESVRLTPRDAQWIRRAPGMAVKVVFRLLYHLPPDYRYRVLFMRRNLADVISSQDAMLASLGRQATPDPRRLLAVLREELSACRRWMEVQPNLAVLYVDYERMLSCPAERASRVAEFLDRDLDLPAMAAAVDPQLWHWGRQLGDHRLPLTRPPVFG